jgi:hypothetical protein
VKKLITILLILLLVCIGSAWAAPNCISDCQSGSKHNCVVVCGSPGTPAAALEKTLKMNLALGQQGDPRGSTNSKNAYVSPALCEARAPERLALLVRNAAALDTEETAALEFAEAHWVSVTAVDAQMVNWQEGILSRYQGIWADRDSEPVEWKDPVALRALKGEIEGGKNLLMMTRGVYLGEYLGYGTVYSDAWNPVLLDANYLVDVPESTDPLVAGLTRWIPPAQPDNEDQLLYRLRAPGYYENYWFAGTGEHYLEATGLWTRYGYWPDSESPCPDLDAQYGVMSNQDRFMFRFPLLKEMAAGQGSLGWEGLITSLSHEWGRGPAGDRLMVNKIAWAMSGGTPEKKVVPCDLPPFTCRAGQYRNLGECVSDCQPGGKQSCVETCKACVGSEEDNENPVDVGTPVDESNGNPADERNGHLALLVRNAAALDGEENAALQFARAHGINVTPVDAGMVASQDGILSGFQGYWAAIGTEPVEWRDPVALAALKNEIEGGKHLFMLSSGGYIGEYLGYGTVYTTDWYPVILDEAYLVDYTENGHPVFTGLSRWIPPSEPDNPGQLLYKLRATGYWSNTYFQGTNEVTVEATGLWTRYGYTDDPTSPYPELDALYGITSNQDRFLTTVEIFRWAPAGQGAVGYGWPCLAREWGLGPMGEKLLTNKILWALGDI